MDSPLETLPIVADHRNDPLPHGIRHQVDLTERKERAGIAVDGHPAGTPQATGVERLRPRDRPCSFPPWPRMAAGSDRFWLLELRVFQTFLDNLRPICSGPGYQPFEGGYMSTRC